MIKNRKRGGKKFVLLPVGLRVLIINIVEKGEFASKAVIILSFGDIHTLVNGVRSGF